VAKEVIGNSNSMLILASTPGLTALHSLWRMQCTLFQEKTPSRIYLLICLGIAVQDIQAALYDYMYILNKLFIISIHHPALVEEW